MIIYDEMRALFEDKEVANRLFFDLDSTTGLCSKVLFGYFARIRSQNIYLKLKVNLHFSVLYSFCF